MEVVLDAYEDYVFEHQFDLQQAYEAYNEIYPAEMTWQEWLEESDGPKSYEDWLTQNA